MSMTVCLLAHTLWFERFLGKEALFIQFFHDDSHCTIEIILFILSDPKLRFDFGDPFRKVLVLFWIPTVLQMSQRDMAHFTAAPV